MWARNRPTTSTGCPLLRWPSLIGRIGRQYAVAKTLCRRELRSVSRSLERWSMISRETGTISFARAREASNCRCRHGANCCQNSSTEQNRARTLVAEPS